jgi:hypothetical protein
MLMWLAKKETVTIDYINVSDVDKTSEILM